jgi:hypothetical protein
LNIFNFFTKTRPVISAIEHAHYTVSNCIPLGLFTESVTKSNARNAAKNTAKNNAKNKVKNNAQSNAKNTTNVIFREQKSVDLG